MERQLEKGKGIRRREEIWEAVSFVPFNLPTISLRGHPQRPGSAWFQDGVDKQGESGSL